jgi:predicted transcriptional regulator of viral defense system
MKQNLGRIETQFFAYIQMRQIRTVRAGDLAASVLHLSPDQERKLLSRLARGGLIARVRQGLYLVPLRLPLGGTWTPTEAEVLNVLMEDRKGRYQICGPNAFNLYGFDNQIPNRIYVYNNRLSGDRRVGTVDITLIKVADARLGDTEEVTMADGEKAVYASRTRSLVDAVYDWSRFNGIPRGYEWIRRELRAGRVSVAGLVKSTLRYGDIGTIRRLGALLEGEGIPETLLRKLERAVKPSTSLIPWIPTQPKRGIANRRWGVVLNERV